MIHFELTKEQEDKFMEWRMSKKSLPPSTVGGAYTFKFTPTGIGIIIEVECVDGDVLVLEELS